MRAARQGAAADTAPLGPGDPWYSLAAGALAPALPVRAGRLSARSVGRRPGEANVEGDHASQTAVATAVLRAAHQVLDDDPKILADPIAVGLVSGSAESEILAQCDGLRTPIAQHLRAALVLRNRFAEDELEHAIGDGLRQYLILGAGLDTFAYRQPPWSKGLRIVEVDAPASQAFKRALLEGAGVRIPENVEFCGVDFEKSSIAEALAASAVDSTAPTFFSWLGVTQYLSRQAMEATLRSVLRFPSPSRIVLSFVLPDPALSGIDAEVTKVAAAASASGGEPWLSRFEPTELERWILDLGFRHAFHLSVQSAETRYFAARNDGLHAPAYSQLICATV